MIKHIVFFSLAENAEGKTKAENAEIIKTALENLINVVPVLRKIEVGINAIQAPAGNFDVALTCEFDNFTDLQMYNQHPEHQKIVAYISKMKTARAAVDYEF